MRYGTQERFPVNVEPVSVWSTRSPDRRRRTTPDAQDDGAADAVAQESAEPLERVDRLLLRVGGRHLPELRRDLGDPLGVVVSRRSGAEVGSGGHGTWTLLPGAAPIRPPG